MPAMAATTIAAHVTSNFSELALWTMIRPRTSDEPPKYSPTIAPMSASVVASFRAVKKYGSAFGMRTLRRTSRVRGGVRAHQLERARLDLGQARASRWP